MSSPIAGRPLEHRDLLGALHRRHLEEAVADRLEARLGKVLDDILVRVVGHRSVEIERRVGFEADDAEAGLRQPPVLEDLGDVGAHLADIHVLGSHPALTAGGAGLDVVLDHGRQEDDGNWLAALGEQHDRAGRARW